MEDKKLSKLVIKDFVKENSAGPRLQSFRLPRDLSLGGSKLPKKIYKPNLNVVRNKEKAREVSPKTRRGKQNRRDEPNPQKQRFIQSTGVFSEGVGDKIRIPEKRVASKSYEEKPQLNIDRSFPVTDKKLQKDNIGYITKYEDDDSEDDCKDNVPFTPINWEPQSLLKEPVNEKIKEECVEFSTILQNHSDCKDESNPLISTTLWHMPDSLSIRSKTETKSTDCKLNDLPQGKIGKLCVRKSGKVEVYVGNVRYELEPAGLESFVEEIVSVNLKSAEEGSVAAVLNKIDNRFVMSPAWHCLLK